MQIFNRWGQPVFISDNPTKGWNGTIEDREAGMDVYVYRVGFRTNKNESKVVNGRVSLIR
jgi:gliding motility-associated-like protein